MKLLSEKFPEIFELIKRKKGCPFCRSQNVISELQKSTSTIFFKCIDCKSTGYKNSEEERWSEKHGSGSYISGY